MAYRNKTRKRINKSIRIHVFERDGYVCGYCEGRRRKKVSSLVIDHIIPVRCGGFHGVENFVAACRKCNRKKWQYAPREKGAPKLLWHCGKMVAKVTWMSRGKRFPRRVPKISYEKHQ